MRVDPLGFFPWGVLLEAGGIVAAVVPGVPFAASFPSVVVVGTMVLVASSSLVIPVFLLIDVCQFGYLYSCCLLLFLFLVLSRGWPVEMFCRW